jgi:hypothetical protein
VPGEFTVYRAGDTTTALTVNYRLSGTAAKFTDYRRPQGDMPEFVTIPAGAASATITIVPVDDTLAEGTETVMLTLLLDPNYNVDAPFNATVTIEDNDPLPLETNPPTVTIVAPDNNSTVFGTLTVSATASDDVGVVGVQFKLDGVNLGAGLTNAPYSLSWDTTSETNGPHTLTAIARDAAENQGASSPVTVFVNNGPPPDVTPPTVAITSPTNSATVSGIITVSGAASDNVGVTGVQFKLDGTDLGSQLITSPYSLNWNTTSATDGSHTLTAVAIDAAGNQATSSSVLVMVSNAPPPDITLPTIAITSPTNDATVSGTVIVTADASDNTSVVAVQFKLDGANLGNEVAAPPFYVSWNTAFRKDDPHKLTAVARDAAGNQGISSPVSVVVSNGPRAEAIVWVDDVLPAGASPSSNYGNSWQWSGSDPAPYAGSLALQSALAAGPHQLYFIEATDTLLVRTGEVLFVYVYLDPAHAPREVMLQWNTGGWGWDHRAYWGENLIGWGTDGTPSLRHMGPLPPAGQWVRLEVPALAVGLEGTTVSGMAFTLYDGRATWDYAGVTASAINPPPPDTAPPTIGITAPVDGTTVSGSSVVVLADASDDIGVAAVQFLMDGTNFGTELTAAPYTLAWDTTLKADGLHTIAAVARDAVGNQTISSPVTVVVSNRTAVDIVWVDEMLPAESAPSADGGDGWEWMSSDPAPFAGSFAHQSAIAIGVHQHYFFGATDMLAVDTGDTLFAYVYLDPANPPSEVMLQWNDGSWEHRAYWGANKIEWGESDTASRYYAGALPPAGQWVRLEIPASAVGLEGATLNGMAFSLYDGRATWDYAGKAKP